MMTRLTLLLVLIVGIFVVGCSDDDNPASSGSTPPPDNTATSTWIASGGYWQSTVDASDYDSFNGFSFDTKDTSTSGLPKVGGVAATGWDIAFRREVIKLNGGTSTGNGGDVQGYDLGAVDYAGVTAADSAGVQWQSDDIDYFIDEWYNYNPVTHELSANQYVYSMVDAEGDNYVKFRIDSLVGAGMPPDMGTVYMTYYYQDTTNMMRMMGMTSEAEVPVGTGTAYFDFSSGQVVTPATPSNSTEWDIGFSSYNIMQNSGPNGSGLCQAFPAFTELVDSTDIDGFTEQPSGAPMFPDIPLSVLTDWYTYTGPPMHQLLSNDHVYLIRTGDKLYKMMIESYYANVGGTPTSGHYTFIWNEL
jgi:hypothetical protein